MLFITFIIASITLLERKILSLIQRRIGPSFVGFKGRLQYLADALKLIFKGIIVPYNSNKLWFIIIPSFTAALCYTFWTNSIWGPSLSIFELEYNIVFANILSLFFGYCIILAGYFSKNKYAFLASIRCGVLMINLEILLGLLFFNLIIIVESFSFSFFNIFQENFWLIFLVLPLFGLVLLIFLLETNRAPFDLSEAESELVAGYSTEYGGFYFALFYLGEYFHLFFFSMIFSIILFGGWEYPSFFFLNNNFFF